MIGLNKKLVFNLFSIYAILMLSIFFSSKAYATDFSTNENLGRENLKQEELKINATSYNPTEPEIQLPSVKYMTIDESGAVMLDQEVVQGALESSGNVYIEGVTHKDSDKYYIKEKGGYIITVAGSKGKIESKNGSVVKVIVVDELYGKNGLATREGFWSNLVPSGFLPKTNLEYQTEENLAIAKGIQYGSGAMVVILGLMLVFMLRKDWHKDIRN